MTATYSETASRNISIGRTVYELSTQQKFEEAATYATEDITVDLYALGLHLDGRAGFIGFMQNLLTAFPDLKIEVVNQVADDSQVASEFTALGTHTGPLETPMGTIPPTGKTVVFTVCEVWKFRDGKIASVHNYQDSASLLRQLGLA
jgi:steroid delta-isomerase-like uncharacterized protein